MCKNRQKPELTSNQKKALTALLSTTSIEAAAKAAGLSPRTVFNYLTNETFRSELRRRQDNIISQTAATLVGLSDKALKTLADVLSDPDASHAVKVRAALGWLKQARETVELKELAERVATLEDILKREERRYDGGSETTY